ncbi:Uncharacterised protein [Burkholderia pseudomallei]|nr:hypothetical protein DR55_477 [Burkholderia pseudomallei HBPUB10134a]CAJ2880064.1 Uncharacterised protein [Burkholderia pseudomallei]CAJ2943913.1 Uncharacterised protein [Burkholderia pseudomallei]CAJ3049109.1 Uncharacterised protein [Burkholderia pseudomallei]CAJ3074865.1 Uncharacterised protein [Burkholderia pseudomallei]
MRISQILTFRNFPKNFLREDLSGGKKIIGAEVFNAPVTRISVSISESVKVLGKFFLHTGRASGQDFVFLLNHF